MSAAPLLAGIFTLTFLSEDAAVLGAAALVASGAVSWPLAFAACFLGIWLGDLWLYGMARAFGAPFVARFGKAAAVERSRAWFERRGSLALVVSRFVPGSRLPCYLAAGATRFPARTFAIVTGLIGVVWVAVVFAGGRLLGAIPPWWLAAGAVAGCGAWQMWGARDALARRDTGDAHKLHWEFWPAWLFYAPVALFYLWLALRHRSFTLPTAANPGMPLGGLVGESKFDTLRALQAACPEAVAEAWLLAPGAVDDRFAGLHILIESHAISLPFILKPDVGQRGAGVKLIRSLDTARAYLAQVPGPVVLQRYAPGPQEAGVFYHRLPGEECGRIFAITEKTFPVVAGDGARTLEELILADPRASIVAETYLRRFAAQRQRVLARGETLRLVEAGNHAQGCIFRDGMRLATPALAAEIDRISRAVPGFFVGRYDLRYASDAALRAGRGFQILELNGASAEATSIYDARNSLLSAYRTLWRQWALVFAIGAANRARGCRPAPLRQVWREWRRASAAIRAYPIAD